MPVQEEKNDEKEVREGIKGGIGSFTKKEIQKENATERKEQL